MGPTSFSSLVVVALAALLTSCAGAETSGPGTVPAPPPTATAPRLASGVPRQPRAYPDAPKKPVSEEFFGTKVVDDYRWLEEGKDPAVVAWTDAENRLTHAYLDGIPARTRIRARVAE